MQTTAYGIRTVVNLPYDEALTRIRASLAENGFGVLTEIDMKAKMKEKLGVDMRRYIILGACNPPLAHKAVELETDIGLLLPCNVIVYEEGAGKSVVAALDPASMVSMTGNPQLEQVATEARAKIVKAIEALGR